MIDFTKPVFTKSGHSVTLIKTDLRSNQPLVGYYYDRDELEEVLQQWTSSGSFFHCDDPSSLDLTNEPPKTLVG